MSLGLKFRLSKWLCPRLLMEAENDVVCLKEKVPC